MGVITVDAGLGEIVPVLDRPSDCPCAPGTRWSRCRATSCSAGASASRPESCRSWLAIASMSAASASVTTSASSPSITARACVPEPPCDGLNLDGFAGLGLPVGGEGRVDRLVELARRIVGDVEQGLARARRAGDERRAQQGRGQSHGEARQYVGMRHQLCSTSPKRGGLNAMRPSIPPPLAPLVY